jgi:hypothetical protein
MNKTSKLGLALCCGISPVFSHNGCAGVYTCPKCAKSASGWITNQKWIASLWNKSCHKTEWIDKVSKYHPAPNLDIGESWRYAELKYNFHPAYGARHEIEDDFILFKVDERPEENWLKSKEGWKYIINKSRCFHDGIVCKKYNGEEFILEALN